MATALNTQTEFAPSRLASTPSQFVGHDHTWRHKRAGAAEPVNKVVRVSGLPRLLRRPSGAAAQRALTLRLLCAAPCSTVPSIRRQAVPLAPRTSLARASGPCTAALVSLLIVCGHFCFAYAQLTGQAQDCPGYAAGNGTGCPQSFAGSDGLAKIIMYADVEYEARGWVASALGLAEEGVCHTSCPHGNQTSIPAGEGAAESVCGLLSCDTCVALFGVGAEQACGVNLHQYLLHMSYLYSVDHLWGQARLNIGIRVQCGARHASRLPLANPRAHASPSSPVTPLTPPSHSPSPQPPPSSLA